MKPNCWVPLGIAILCIVNVKSLDTFRKSPKRGDSEARELGLGGNSREYSPLLEEPDEDRETKCKEECGEDYKTTPGLTCVSETPEPDDGNLIYKCVCDDKEEKTQSFDKNTHTCRASCDPEEKDFCKHGAKCEGEGEGEAEAGPGSTSGVEQNPKPESEEEGEGEEETAKAFCKCLKGTSGDDCGKIDACEADPSFCGEGNIDKCVYDHEKLKADCDCENEDEKFDFLVKQCRAPCDTESENVCKNGAKCGGEGDNKFCDCLKGTSGNDCGTIDACTDHLFCGDGNEDKCVYDQENLNADCKCDNAKEKYDFSLKICRIPCDPSNATACKNGGKCGGEGGNKFCSCLKGTSGNDCGIIDACQENPLFCGQGNIDKCVYDQKRLKADCECDDITERFDFSVGKCRLICDPGNADACQNGAKCEGDYFRFCNCNKGTSGDVCEDIDACKENPLFCGEGNIDKCIYDHEKLTPDCKCENAAEKYNFLDKECRLPCDPANEDACKNGAKCGGEGVNKFCSCLNGTSGGDCGTIDECEKDPLFCGEGNTDKCVYDEETLKADCKCEDAKEKFDFSIKECRIPCNPDDKDFCKHGAKCEVEEGRTFCNCLKGTSGHDCGTVDACQEDPMFCGEGNIDKCVYDPKNLKADCKCESLEEKFDFLVKKCRTPCDPSKASCKNGAECEGEDTNKFCKCPKGTSGNNCEVVDQCKNPKFCGEKDDVDCVYDTASSKATCKCRVEGKEYDGLSKLCRIPCGSDDCKNGAKCEGTDPLKFCRCKPRTSGDNCEVVDQCKNNPKYCGETKDVECVYNMTSTRATCQCKSDEKQYDQSVKMCRTPCATADDCENGAKCIGTDPLKFCKCPKGTSGDKCDVVDQCKKELKFCGEKDDVDCVYNKTTSQPTCKCHVDEKKYDKKDKMCKTLCEGKDDCLNGGTCDGTTQLCVCVAGYDGEWCEEITGCRDLKKPCEEQGGTCVFDNSTPTKARCQCSDENEVYDERYEVCIEACKKDDCLNGGTCDGGSKLCVCVDGYTGSRCEEIKGCKDLKKTCDEAGATCIFDATVAEKARCQCTDKTKVYDKGMCKKSCSKGEKCENGEKCNPTSKLCECEEGYGGDDCKEILGCKDLEDTCKKAAATCVYDKLAPTKANCKCDDDLYQYIGKECKPTWCQSKPCKDGAICELDKEKKTGYCNCNSTTKYYDYLKDKCIEPDKCILRKESCGKNMECSKGVCICPEGYKADDGKCTPDFCKSKKPCFPGAECSDADGIVTCRCKEGEYFDGKKCADGKCFLGDYKKKCGICPPNFEKKEDNTCVHKAACSKDCGYGYCVKEGDKEVCKCISSVALLKEGKCVLRASLCASNKLVNDSSKCECVGKYKQAENEITCDLRSCSDGDAQDVCKKMGAECVMDWKKKYDCKCPKGYFKDATGETCTDLCSIHTGCLENDQFCYNSPSRLKSDVFETDCQCPPSLQYADGKCSELAGNQQLILNIPVLRGRYVKGKGIDYVRLSADLTESMRRTFKNLDYGYLHSYQQDGDILKSTVWMQFKQGTDAKVEANRALLQPSTFECDECDTSLTLWPPSILLSKEHLKQVETEKLTFCSDSAKNSLCGENAACDNKTNTCSCPTGFKTLHYTIRQFSQFKIQRCEDIDECKTGAHDCPGNTTCVNTPGDYYCECKPNFKKEKDSLISREIKDKANCVDLCNPSPCDKGTCVVTKKSFDCRCPEGYEGTFCDRTSVSLAGAKKSTAVVGAILGTLLGVVLIAFFLFYWRVKKNSYSEDFEQVPRQSHAAEMMERRPVRGVSNPSYE